MKEMTGSGVVAANGANGASESTATDSTNKTRLRVYQLYIDLPRRTSMIFRHLSEIADASIFLRSLPVFPEVAKQGELSGMLQSESDAKNKKQIYIECKIRRSVDMTSLHLLLKLSRVHLLLSPPNQEKAKTWEEPVPRNVRTSVEVSNVSSSFLCLIPTFSISAGGQTRILLAEEPVVKAAKKIYNHKFQELTGNGIFKGDHAPPGSAEKPISRAKLRVMTGNDIFSDGIAESLDYGAVPKPPGGESSIALV